MGLLIFAFILVVALIVALIILSTIAASNNACSEFRKWHIVGLLFAASAIAFALSVTPLFAISRNKQQRSLQFWFSNLKSLGVAQLLYASDFDNISPPTYRWDKLNYEYTENRDKYHCNLTELNIHYGMNQSLGGSNLEKVEHAGSTLLLAEKLNTNQKPLISGYKDVVLPHDRKGNICFAGGHVKTYTTERLLLSLLFSKRGHHLLFLLVNRMSRNLASKCLLCPESNPIPVQFFHLYMLLLS